MNRTLGTVLIIWNLVLSGLLVWTLMRSPEAVPAVVESGDTSARVRLSNDTSAHPDAAIAFFYMDSVQRNFKMVKDKGDQFRSEGQRLEKQLQQELQRSEGRYQELMQKDHTYSTNAEIQADEQEVQRLMQKIQTLQQQGQERMADLEVNMLEQISNEIVDFLKEHNEQGRYHYIFSVQSGGQIWVGEDATDLTHEVVSGLNARYAAAKEPKKAPIE